MTWLVQFYVPGKPVGKGRPKFGNGRAYTPKTTVVYEKAVREAAKAAMVRCGVERKDRTPVAVSIEAEFAIPKSYNKTKRELCERQLVSPPKPDIDNIAKSVLDGISGTVVDDDVCVTRLNIRKVYGKTNQVFVSVMEDY